MSSLQLACKAEDLFLGVPDPITLTVSVLALLVSAASAIATWRINSRQSRHQERLVDLETAREQDRQRLARSAELRASIGRDKQDFRERMIPRSATYWLAIRNDGMALAQNVRILLDGKPFLEHTLVPHGEEEITTIGPGTEHRYILAVSLQSASIVDALIQWDDDSGEPRRWESKLKIV